MKDIVANIWKRILDLPIIKRLAPFFDGLKRAYQYNDLAWQIKQGELDLIYELLKTKNTIVAIVGSHPGTRGEFDFDRTDCDVWVFNEALSRAESTDANEADLWCKHADAIFQMHAPAVWRNPKNRNDHDHHDWLTSGNTPVIYMMDAYVEVPRAIKYPLDEVSALVGGSCQKFMTSSVTHALALALYQGYKKIEVYGVEMETETEYIFQRDGVTYWFGVIDGMGIELETHCGFMVERYIYGYEGQINIPVTDYTTRIGELEPERDKAKKAFEDAHIDYNGKSKAFAAKPHEPESFVKLTQDLVDLAKMYGLFDGGIQENNRYLKKIEEMQAASDEDFLIVRQEYEQQYQAVMKVHANNASHMAALMGQLDTLFQSIISTGNMKKRITRMNKFIDQLALCVNQVMKVGVLWAVAQENHLYAKKLDKLIRASGGEKSVEAIKESEAVPV